MEQIKYKTKWVAPLEDLPGYFQRRAQEIPRRARQSIDAVFQLYGYVTFNENKYGTLNNMECAWFFQRVETPDGQGITLEYYGPIKFDSGHSPSMLKASFCLPKLGFIVPQPLAKYPPADTSVRLPQLFVTVTQPLRMHTHTIRSS